MNYQDKELISLVNYVISTDWRSANSILYKYGYPAIEKVDEMRDNLLELLKDKRKGKLALRDLINLDTPYKRLLIADLEDSEDHKSNFGGYTYGEYDTPFPRIQHQDELIYPNGHPYARKIATTSPRTRWDDWEYGVISGSNFSGNNDSMSVLVIVAILIAFIYFLNKV